jgi:biopolymer transport protein ExbB
MQDWQGIVEAARLGGWIVYPLTLLALLALVIIADRSYVLWRFASRPASLPGGDSERALPGIDTAHASGAARALQALPSTHAWRRLGLLLLDRRAEPVWWLEAQIESIALEVERDMSRGLWVLETIVTAAPLLGLLGTIVGMMRAFQLIGANGLVNPTGVTGGVAQALIATAIGLVIAVAALFAFNFLSRRVDRLMDQLESFANTGLSEIRLARERGGEST